MIDDIGDPLNVSISQLTYFVRIIHAPFTIFKYFEKLLNIIIIFKINESISSITFVLIPLILNT